MEQKIDLRDVLQQLGIKNIFTKEADLSAMTAETEGACACVHVRACLHASYILESYSFT